MGHRQLALVFGIGTAVFALLIAAARMAFKFGDFGNGLILTAVLYILSPIVLLIIAKKKWDLGYMNAIAMLLSSSIICAIVYSLGYGYVQDAFPEMKGEDDDYVFWGLFTVNLIPRIPIDAVVAIFQKRNS